MSDDSLVVPLLSRALHRIRATPPRIIASPPTQPRRAAVALIIRISSPSAPLSPPSPPTTQPTPQATPQPPPSLTDFFEQEWVKSPTAKPEILFLRRDRPDLDDGARNANTGEAHVAFPGGRMEEGDEGGLYTAMRQTWEEIGLDLAEKHYTCIGQLDDREITTSLGKRLLMILSPFVFLQLTQSAPPPDPAPSTSLHWIPLASLLPPSALSPAPAPAPSRRLRDRDNTKPKWSTVTVDASSRLAPRHSTVLRVLVRLLVGSMKFPAIILDTGLGEAISPPQIVDEKKSVNGVNGTIGAKKLENGDAHTIDEKTARKIERNRAQKEQQLKLWGLSLGMTLDLLAYMATPPDASRGSKGALALTSGANPHSRSSITADLNGGWLLPLPFYADEVAGVEVGVLAPSLTSVVPRFGYPDVNFWIWVFGKRYREVIRGWEASVRAGGTNDRRINWTGSALSTFYAAIRKALVVVIVVRAIGLILGLVGLGWWVFWR
ncbi:hypothetical protein JAAARDRAFT_37915 [Jaapia argillacea MUCL 33604]|uniref:Nudix hydrolase domain-containing protein n=1 Tax=Jaapia argillacea MUCL 33604 TaxID=933084 RepID=A0A067PJ10_9AGAM|nr:hypothetical protein JAAARDRAFT_37915 [Jaapia argillacea MUCL 33604]